MENMKSVIRRVALFLDVNEMATASIIRKHVEGFEIDDRKAGSILRLLMNESPNE